MADKTIALNQEVLDKLPKDVFSSLIGAFNDQIGEAKLEKEAKDALKEKLAAEKAKIDYIACMNYPEILDEDEFDEF